MVLDFVFEHAIDAASRHMTTHPSARQRTEGVTDVVGHILAGAGYR